MTNILFTQHKWLLFLAGMGFLPACSKSSFLDKKPNTDFVVPSTLSDFQALLDNDAVMSVTPALGELSADNFYLDYAFWQNLDVTEHNAYIWAPGDIFNGQGQQDEWDLPYEQVFYANTVLAGLPTVVDSLNSPDWKALKGAALFIRAYAFYNIAQLFATVYDPLSAATDPGIPLRLDPGVSTVSTRASVRQTYFQILQDLRGADSLLPVPLALANRNRPTKPAAYALQARIYLSMRMYDSTKLYADSCLQLDSTLIDYNTVSTGSILPFTSLNTETLYQSKFLTSSDQILVGIIYPSCKVDSLLYASYATGDLRSKIFYEFNGSYANIKGSYNGSIYPFSGLATDEVYLDRAECRARAGDLTGALSDLNTLLVKRWKAGTYTPFTAGSATEALDTILVERRKELAFRGLRWTDLRRLNKEGANITLTRNLNGQIDQLAPNSPLYVLPIPPDVIALSGMPQNPRPQP